MRSMKALACVLCVLCGQFAGAQASEIRFDANADFLKPPAGMSFGEVTGVAVNA